MTDKNNSQSNINKHIIKAGAAGCLLNALAIFLIIGAAIGLGLWLDAHYSDGKHIYTFGLVVASIPVTLVIVFFLARWISSWVQPPKVKTQPGQEGLLEDSDSGSD